MAGLLITEDSTTTLFKPVPRFERHRYSRLDCGISCEAFGQYLRRSSCWAELLGGAAGAKFCNANTCKPDLGWRYMHGPYRNVQLIQTVKRIASREMLREKDTIPLLSFSWSRESIFVCDSPKPTAIQRCSLPKPQFLEDARLNMLVAGSDDETNARPRGAEPRGKPLLAFRDTVEVIGWAYSQQEQPEDAGGRMKKSRPRPAPPTFRGWISHAFAFDTSSGILFVRFDHYRAGAGHHETQATFISLMRFAENDHNPPWVPKHPALIRLRRLEGSIQSRMLRLSAHCNDTISKG